MTLDRAPWSPRRLNRLASALHCRRYLEVGVEQGQTFFMVSCPQKVGVDPHFQFDTLARFEGIDLYEMASDQYFEALEEGATFDLIFLDGLHTFEQTYRDLTHALLHSHDRTVILIDDTWPLDYFSSIPDQALALSLRGATGLEDRSWHGDVFKVVFAIREHHPELAYRTIRGSGNPQTLVWKSGTLRRTRTITSPDSLTRISSLTYTDFLGNSAVMKPAREEDAIARCVSELRQRT